MENNKDILEQPIERFKDLKLKDSGRVLKLETLNLKQIVEWKLK
jgi:hypothetical protein